MRLRMDSLRQGAGGDQADDHCPYLYGPLRAYGISVREKEVLTRFAEGKRIGQIAEEDGVTVNTVKYYLRQSYKKLNVHSRKELAELLDGLDDTVKG